MRILRLGVALWANLIESIYRPVWLVWKEKSLVKMLIRREIASRTAGTFLGAAWMVAQPALQIFGTWFFLSVVLRVRTQGALPFMNYFLVGMIAWTMLNEIWQRCTVVLVEFSSLYQKTIFPMALLPLLPVLVSGSIYGFLFVFAVGLLEGPAMCIPALGAILLLALWSIPVGYVLAVLGLFLKEIRQAAPIALSLLMYLTPILYMPEQLPIYLRDWSVLNPLADSMALLHATLQGQFFTAGNILRPLCLWLLMMPAAWLLFKRTEPHMREAL